MQHAHHHALEHAFVLHQKPHRERSVLVDFFTEQQGRVSAIVPLKKQLSLFTPLLISWSSQTDKSELVFVEQLESAGVPLPLSGEALLCGFYLNELLVRLMPRYDAFPRVYSLYEKTLRQLMLTPQQLESALRLFEKGLLEGLGYGLLLDCDARTEEAIEPDALYQYLPDYGFVRVSSAEAHQWVCHGRTLIGLSRGELNHPIVLQQAKKILRHVLQQHLGSKPLSSRLLF